MILLTVKIFLLFLQPADEAKENIRLMMLFQCDNARIEATGDVPRTDIVSQNPHHSFLSM